MDNKVEYDNWINKVINPSRIEKGLKPISESEAALCYSILVDFQEKMKNKEKIS